MKTIFSLTLALFFTASAYAQTSYEGVFVGAFRSGNNGSIYYDTAKLTLDNIPASTFSTPAKLSLKASTTDSFLIEILTPSIKNGDTVYNPHWQGYIPKDIKSDQKYIYNGYDFMNITVLDSSMDSLSMIVYATSVSSYLVSNGSGGGHHLEYTWENVIGTLRFVFPKNSVSLPGSMRMAELLNIYPSSVREAVNIRYQNEGSQQLRYSILNIAGNQLLDGVYDYQPSLKYLTIQTSSLPSGLYLIKLTDNINVYQGKFLKY